MQKVDIIYEDENILAVNKPSGFSVFPEGEEKGVALIDLLVDEFPELKKSGEPPRYGIVHRLDKKTSGVLLVAKNNSTLEFLQEKFKKGEVEKRYIALCYGLIPYKTGVIETLMARSPKDRRKQKAYPLYDILIKGKARKAITHYRVLKKIQNYTLIELVILTGRKHQIRCHMAHLGYPIAGDDLYGFRDTETVEGLFRQFLHSQEIVIDTPKIKKKKIYCELPNDLQKILNNLEKNE